MQKQTLILLFTLLWGSSSFGQRVQWQTFRLTEENDFFNITHRVLDYYYTQGMRFEFQYQVSKRKFIEKLVLPASPTAINVYSFSATQQIYTPKETDTYYFEGDRPYAGALYLSEILESVDSSKQFRLTTRLDAGMIGPAALAKQTQLLFHKIINNTLAVGWDTQLRNDIFLNYSIKAEQAFTKRTWLLNMEAKCELNIGTTLFSIIPGLNIGVGTWHQKQEKFYWQIFFRPEGRLVFYNALLQGGIFNRANADEYYSKYFIKEINQLVYSHSIGFRVGYNRFQFLYRQVSLTPEFSNQLHHYYSTLMFTFPLNGKSSKN